MDTYPDATVLVVDDTPENLAAVGCFLEGLCPTAAAQSGEEALELALKLRPDVILLDVVMPGMSGMDVLKELQANPVTKSISVLLVTSLSDPESKLEGFACGAVDFVSKPLLAGELRARVATQLRIRQLERDLRQKIRSLNEEISENRQNFDFLAEHIDTCLFCVDAWDRIVLVNPACSRLLGRDSNGALGKLFFHIFIAADQDMARKSIRQALEARQTHVDFTARVQAPQGVRTFQVSACFPRVTQSSSHQWCAVLSDITTTAQEKEKWKSAHEHLQAHYASCWEQLNHVCADLRTAMQGLHPPPVRQENARPINASELQMLESKLLSLASASDQVLQFVCKNKIPPAPAVSAEALPTLAAPGSASPLPRRTCLVLESSPVQARLFSILLSDCGFPSIAIASDVEAAVAELGKGRPDVLVADDVLLRRCVEDEPDFLNFLRNAGTRIVGVLPPGAPELEKQWSAIYSRVLYRPVSLYALRDTLI